jgi:hypothetical protein
MQAIIIIILLILYYNILYYITLGKILKNTLTTGAIAARAQRLSSIKYLKIPLDSPWVKSYASHRVSKCSTLSASNYNKPIAIIEQWSLVRVIYLCLKWSLYKQQNAKLDALNHCLPLKRHYGCSTVRRCIYLLGDL